MQLTAEQIARVAHEANRVVQYLQADPGVPVAAAWDNFPAEEQNGVIEGVVLAQQGATPEQLHENWRRTKEEQGWVFGEVKSAEAKTHPALVPYDRLPESQKTKDRLFSAIVEALSPPTPSERDRVIVYQGMDGDWRWTQIAANNRKIATSGEGYQDKGGAVAAAIRATGREPQVLV